MMTMMMMMMMMMCPSRRNDQLEDVEWLRHNVK